MSHSEKDAGKVRLVVDAPDPFTSIYVIDGKFDLISRGVGRLEDELRPGLYVVKFKTGLMIKDVNISLNPGSEPVHVSAPPMEISTSVPIANTLTARPEHLISAHELSQHPSLELGRGGQLFAFVRDLEEGVVSDPATGLTLRDLNGKLLVDFRKEGRRSLKEQWAGAMIEVDPGLYRLRVNNRSVGVLEQTVAISPGWQTQVFMLRSAYGTSRKKGRYPDISNSSILMARQGEGFVPDREDLRWTETARVGLAEGHSLVPPEDLRSLLREKTQNPMLGIFAAHLVLAAREPQLKLVNTVLENLEGWLGTHPDVLALKLRLAELEGKRLEKPPSFSSPPMLRESWSIVVNASAASPEIVPAGSLASQIAMSLWGSGTWLVWNKPSASKMRGAVRKQAAQERLDQVLPELRALAASPGAMESLYADAELNDLEQNLLQYISLSSAAPRLTTLSADDQPGLGMTKGVKDVQPPVQDLSEQTIVQALQVPNTTARQAAASLIQKLKGRAG